MMSTLIETADLANTPLCIYHANCPDGFGAAWCVWKYFNGKVELYAANYQQAAPDVKGRDVYIVDFSYKRAVLLEMMNAAKHVVLLDHHKTAFEELDGIDNFDMKLDMTLTNDYSGAMLAWNYFFYPAKPPALLKHVQDRDLWRFEMPGTREVFSSLASYPYDMLTWNRLMTEDDIPAMYREGAGIVRKFDKDLAELLKSNKRNMVIAGYEVPVLNAPYMFASEAGNAMMKTDPRPAFAATYSDGPHGRAFSLRSVNEAYDVSAIAKHYGGGGHRNASGFLVDWDTLREYHKMGELL